MSDFDAIANILGTKAEEVKKEVIDEKPEIVNNLKADNIPPVEAKSAEIPEGYIDFKSVFDGYEDIDSVKKALSDKDAYVKRLSEMEEQMKDRTKDGEDEMLFRLRQINKVNPDRTKEVMKILAGNYDSKSVLIESFLKKNPDLKDADRGLIEDMVMKKYTLNPIEYKEWEEEDRNGDVIKKNNKSEVDARNREIELSKLQMQIDSKESIKTLLDDFNNIEIPKDNREEYDKKFTEVWKPVIEKFKPEIDLSIGGVDLKVEVPKDVFDVVKRDVMQNLYHSGNIPKDANSEFGSIIRDAVWAYPTFREKAIQDIMKHHEDKVVQQVKQGIYNSSALDVNKKPNDKSKSSSDKLISEISDWASKYK